MTWKPMGNVSQVAVREARLEAHHAVQWLAKLARAFCAPEADDCHTSLTWDPDKAAFVSRLLAKDLTVGLRLHDLSLVWQGGDEQQCLSLPGHTEREVGEWINHRVSSRGMDSAFLQNPQPYTLPSHSLDTGGSYGQATRRAFEELSIYYSNAAHLLEYVRSSQQGASPVRCWPHHFDITTLIALDQSAGEEARSIGVGCSPGDDTFPESYFYLSPWPYPSPSATLPPVIPPAFWHREGYTAIILKVEDIRSFAPADIQDIQTQSILDQGILVNRELLLSANPE